MRTVQTEPFAPADEPFAPIEGYDPGVEQSEYEDVPVDATDVAEYTEMPDTAEDVSETPDDGNKTIRLNTYTPTYVKAILKKRADAERRSVTVVLTEVLRQYLLKDMNEPRPYIPAEARPAFVGDRVRLGALIPSTMFHALNERADSEGRDVSTIITRAILDYLETEVD